MHAELPNRNAVYSNTRVYLSEKWKGMFNKYRIDLIEDGEHEIGEKKRT
jgi:hypothetical protein